jgi:hypothetical protein
MISLELNLIILLMNLSEFSFFIFFTKKILIYLDFLSITDIDLILDENEESHQDIKIFWMKLIL